MPTNSLLTASQITREGLRLFKNSNALLGNIDKQYDDSFAKTGAKIGSTLRVRLPNDYTIRRGQSTNVQGTNEQSTTITVANQIGVDLQFSSAERSLSLDDYSERVLAPAINNLAGQIALDVMGATDGIVAPSGLYSDTQLPAATMAGKFNAGAILTPDTSTFLAAGALLDQMSAPRGNRKILLDPITQSRAVSGLAGLFNPATEISQQYRSGTIKNALGFDFVMDQTTLIHNTASYGALPTVAGANQTGTSLTVSALAAPLNAGDVITIAGVNSVNRVNKKDNGSLAQFVVTANVLAGATVIPIYPALTPPSGGNAVQFQTVTASPANGAAITCLTQASAAYRMNLAYVPEALTMVTADLELPKGVHEAHREVYDNVSMRIVTAYNVANDQFVTRLDVLFGYKVLRPEWVCRIPDVL